MSDRYRCLDNFDLAQVALNTVSDMNAVVQSSEITESRLYLQIVTPRIEFEVKQGDIVQAGFIVSNSEIGMGSLKVEPLIHRLVCLNGMVVNDAAMRKYHVGRSTADLGNMAQEVLRDETRKTSDRAFWMTVQDVLRNVVSEAGFEEMTRKFVKSTEVEMKADPIEVVERVKTQFQLTDGEGTSVLKNLLMGNDMTQFGLINAITAVSKEEEVQYDRAVELERTGGMVMEMTQTDWRKLDATD
jgi:hypothetical protein